MVVPESPKMPGSSPAFWFGLQTAKGDGALVQPIMAKELGYRPGSGSSFFMFQGEAVDISNFRADCLRSLRPTPHTTRGHIAACCTCNACAPTDHL